MINLIKRLLGFAVNKEKKTPGIYEGEVCNRESCHGEIRTYPVENCSCHISPPCSACTSPRNYCNKCDWEEANEEAPPQPMSNCKPLEQWYKPRTFADLDRTKIDYLRLQHTHFSMIVKGVYPEGATMEEVRKKVNGTFGGRFNSFGNGKFEFVAYTD